MKTRKLSLRDEDLPESSMASKTRPRNEIEPKFGMQLASPPPPSPPPSLNEKQDLNIHTMSKFGMQPASPPPPSPPPSLNENQDLNIHTDLRMCFYFQPSTPAPEQPQPPPQVPPPPLPPNENQDVNIDLTMCVCSPPEPPPQPDNRQELSAINSIHVPQPQPQSVVAPATRRQRRNPTKAPREGKPPTIEPPFSWATDRRAHVHSLKYLTERGITTISGDVQCKRCDEGYQIEYNLEQKFSEVSRYVAENKYSFRERAPAQWMNPTFLKCERCHQENSAKPKIVGKKKAVNWLFLLLGQMLGCCTLDQLKYFCKHTGCHRTGAKDRVLFLTYLELCKQVDPDGPFDRCQSVSGFR
ncbi:hypothetical protein L2E82_00601 [Cichorium intybus]|uniref:Uncharacterized protein n=1 Tax=Cichorium intybus TaxID=13427 RepID=A0ACB9GX42_CICIN|nr:hypothetical protein L2E82_00601 [Cichorium intybus]